MDHTPGAPASPQAPTRLPLPEVPAGAEPPAPAGEAEPATDGEHRATAEGMRLLAAGVPLTLLLDLSLPLDSAGISADEGGSAAWLPH